MSWTDTAEQLAEQILGCKMYVVDADALPNEFKTPNIGGCTSGMMDLALRPILESQGRWDGRRPATTLFPSRLTTNARLPGWTDHCAICGTMHEVAHVAERLAVERLLCELIGNEHTPTSQRAFDALSSELQQAAMMEAIARPIERPLQPWAGHTASYIRAALHVVHRANLFGYYHLRPREIRACGQEYGTSEIHVYTYALDGEPERLQDVPLVDVLTTEPPSAFEALFTADTMRGSNAH